MPKHRNGSKGDSNPGSLPCESGILPLSYRAPQNYILVNVTFIPVFKRAGIEEWRDEAVFLCCDGAAVNLGKKNGVAAKLKDDVGHLVSVHCVAHRLELGVTKAIKEAPE